MTSASMTPDADWLFLLAFGLIWVSIGLTIFFFVISNEFVLDRLKKKVTAAVLDAFDELDEPSAPVPVVDDIWMLPDEHANDPKVTGLEPFKAAKTKKTTDE